MQIVNLIARNFPIMTLRREYRSRVRIPAEFRTDDGAARVTSVIDISEDGCRLHKSVDGLVPGTGLSIAIGTLAPVSARVRWRYGLFCGVAFTRPLATTLIDHFEHVHARGPLKERELPRL